jgi:hypothetical protein
MTSWPARSVRATASVAATMYETSGSRVFESGVGTAIAMQSGSLIRFSSVVAENLPAFTNFARRSDGTSWMCEVPLFRRSVTRLLMSNPMTVKPASAISMARGRPTYPRPTMPTTAVRSWAFCFSCCAWLLLTP